MKLRSKIIDFLKEGLGAVGVFRAKEAGLEPATHAEDCGLVFSAGAGRR